MQLHIMPTVHSPVTACTRLSCTPLHFCLIIICLYVYMDFEWLVVLASAMSVLV